MAGEWRESYRGKQVALLPISTLKRNWLSNQYQSSAKNSTSLCECREKKTQTLQSDFPSPYQPDTDLLCQAHLPTGSQNASHPLYTPGSVPLLHFLCLKFLLQPPCHVSVGQVISDLLQEAFPAPCQFPPDDSIQPGLPWIGYIHSAPLPTGGFWSAHNLKWILTLKTRKNVQKLTMEGHEILFFNYTELYKCKQSKV